MSNETIIGFLTGSLATGLVTKVLEMIQKSKEHKYSLEKAFFEKKLLAAEAVVAYWYGSSLMATNMATLFRLSVDNENISQPIILSAQAELNNEMKKIQQIQSNAHFSFPLYFDLEDSFLWSGEAFEAYVSATSAAYIIANRIDNFTGGESQGASESGDAAEIAQLKEELFIHIEKMVGAIETNKKLVSGLIRKAKLELKQYERKPSIFQRYRKSKG